MYRAFSICTEFKRDGPDIPHLVSTVFRGFPFHLPAPLVCFRAKSCLRNILARAHFTRVCALPYASLVWIGLAEGKDIHVHHCSPSWQTWFFNTLEHTRSIRMLSVNSTIVYEPLFAHSSECVSNLSPRVMPLLPMNGTDSLLSTIFFFSFRARKLSNW